jgi:hypothetical protein
MPRVLNIKINYEGIGLDSIDYDEHGDFDDRKDLESFGYRFWWDSPRDIVRFLEKHLVKNIGLYDRVDIDVEGVKNE